MTNICIVYETPTLNDVREVIREIRKQQSEAQEGRFRPISHIELQHDDYLRLLGDLFPNMSPVPSDTSFVYVEDVRIVSTGIGVKSMEEGYASITKGQVFGATACGSLGKVGRY